ncbi:toll/interleukin-1 receptor domain-containing protein [Bradyrhizobium sp. SZCCHNS3052]|uniref:toll/interleukin-1 receptor domain-containing protein n=1 Tax=Bradyrhizobium sp. SZCCHNS3052 TaxID=3057321 RepID=UPI002916B51F|nr:toll/interleukin-1 receptor domain-containing protein [Bradyrhizobium sp. SZCCHNS3052]
MVEYITRDTLRRNAGTLNEQVSIVRKAQARSPQGSTFLSHSTKDADILPGVIAILERHGAVVYVDKKDESLPPTTSRETATILKNRIRQSRKFLLLTTMNSKDSRWMPWELGLADGYKTPANTAIFPSVDTAADHRWAEREYLGIYDRVVFGKFEGHPTPVFMVYNQEKNVATELSAWLNA